MVMGTTLDTVNLSNLYSWFVSAFCSLAGGRQTRRPIDLGGVLYRESFFAGEGIILEGEQDQSPYDTGHRAISPCLRFCLKTCCYESAAAIETSRGPRGNRSSV